MIERIILRLHHCLLFVCFIGNPPSGFLQAAREELASLRFLFLKVIFFTIYVCIHAAFHNPSRLEELFTEQ